MPFTPRTAPPLVFNHLHPAQSGITRKKAATGATYTQPDFHRPLTAQGSSAAAGLGSEGRRGGIEN